MSRDSMQKQQIKPDPSIHLNIENPNLPKISGIHGINQSRVIKTSAFHMNQIIKEFDYLLNFLNQVYDEVGTVNLKERKKIKKIVLSSLTTLIT